MTATSRDRPQNAFGGVHPDRFCFAIFMGRAEYPIPGQSVGLKHWNLQYNHLRCRAVCMCQHLVPYFAAVKDPHPIPCMCFYVFPQVPCGRETVSTYTACVCRFLVCIFMCALSCPDSVKLFPHVLHKYGFSPVCILTCALSCPACVKLFPHVMQVYGFSPVCILMCALSVPPSPKLFPHVLQVYGFSPVCIIICLFR